MALLKVENLSVEFQTNDGAVQAVKDLSFELEKGHSLAIVGESGSGKSQTAFSIMGLLAENGRSSGRVLIEGKDILNLPISELNTYRAEKMAMIFQDPMESLNARHTVGEILEEPFLIHGIGNAQTRRQSVSKLLDTVGLPGRSASRYPFEFSGGQRQRIGIARAIALKPELIICDEPVSALDVSIQSQILNLLMELQKEFNLAYLFIAHDLAVVKHISDRVAIMYLGKIVEQASSNEIYHRPFHPYTQSLISAIPIPDPHHSATRILLKGDVPSPISPPPGCAFHTRCPKASESCQRDVPILKTVAPEHIAACHFAEAP